MGPTKSCSQKGPFSHDTSINLQVFGGIAAANALSDVYAMGATPIFAMNIASGSVCGSLMLSYMNLCDYMYIYSIYTHNTI